MLAILTLGLFLDLNFQLINFGMHYPFELQHNIVVQIGMKPKNRVNSNLISSFIYIYIYIGEKCL